MSDINKTVLHSWGINAEAWNILVDAKGIPSRTYTNNAILQAINLHHPKTILDVGCGEGWIAGELGEDVSYTGIDGTDFLIEKAKLKNPKAIFHLSTYDDILLGKTSFLSTYNVIVFNYSLYQKDNLGQLLQVLSSFLDKNGHVLIQTVHPYFLVKNFGLYRSSWVENAWDGLQGDFKAPHPWYCRTFQAWFMVFKNAGFQTALQEITSASGEPISVIFILSLNK